MIGEYGCLQSTTCNVHLHGWRAHLQMLLWKAADRPDPPAVDITKFGWNKKEGEKEGEEVIMPVLDASPIAPPALLDIIICSWVKSHAQQQSIAVQLQALPVPATASAMAMTAHVAPRSHTHINKSKMTKM